MKPTGSIPSTFQHKPRLEEARLANPSNRVGEAMQNLSTSNSEMLTKAKPYIKAQALTPQYGILDTADLCVKKPSDPFASFLLGFSTYQGYGLKDHVSSPSIFYEHFIPNSQLSALLFPSSLVSHPFSITKQTQKAFLQNPLLRQTHRTILDFSLARFGLRRQGKEIHCHKRILSSDIHWLALAGKDDRFLLRQIVESLHLLDNTQLANSLCNTAINLLKKKGLFEQAHRFTLLKSELAVSLTEQKVDTIFASQSSYLAQTSMVAAHEAKTLPSNLNPIALTSQREDRVFLVKKVESTEPATNLWGHPLRKVRKKISPLAQYSWFAEKLDIEGDASEEAVPEIKIIEQKTNKELFYSMEITEDDYVVTRKKQLTDHHLGEMNAIASLEQPVTAGALTKQLIQKDSLVFLPSEKKSFTKLFDFPDRQNIDKVKPRSKLKSPESGVFNPLKKILSADPLSILKEQREQFEVEEELEVQKPSSIIIPHGSTAAAGKGRKVKNKLRKIGVEHKNTSFLSAPSLEIAVRLSNARCNLKEENIEEINEIIVNSDLQTNSLCLLSDLSDERLAYVDNLIVARNRDSDSDAIEIEDITLLDNLDFFKEIILRGKSEPNKEGKSPSTTFLSNEQQATLDKIFDILVKQCIIAEQAALDDKVIKLNLLRELTPEQKNIVLAQIENKARIQQSMRIIIPYCQHILYEIAQELKISLNDFLIQSKLNTLVSLKMETINKIDEILDIINKLELEKVNQTQETHKMRYQNEIEFRKKELQLRQEQYDKIMFEIEDNRSRCSVVS